MDCSPPGSSVHGILQARILKLIAMPSIRESSWPRDQTHIPAAPELQADSSPLSHQESPNIAQSPQNYLLSVSSVSSAVSNNTGSQ